MGNELSKLQSRMNESRSDHIKPEKQTGTQLHPGNVTANEKTGAPIEVKSCFPEEHFQAVTKAQKAQISQNFNLSYPASDKNMDSSTRSRFDLKLKKRNDSN